MGDSTNKEIDCGSVNFLVSHHIYVVYVDKLKFMYDRNCVSK